MSKNLTNSKAEIQWGIVYIESDHSTNVPNLWSPGNTSLVARLLM